MKLGDLDLLNVTLLKQEFNQEHPSPFSLLLHNALMSFQLLFVVMDHGSVRKHLLGIQRVQVQALASPLKMARW